MKKLSICIPTYNRSSHLNNCLNSIYLNVEIHKNIEICVSDNNSSDDLQKIIKLNKNKFDIKLNTNRENIGIANNILKAVEISTAKFCWIIGDDDLLFDCAIDEIIGKIKEHEDVDFYYVNSKHLHHNKLDRYKKPINPNIIKESMPKFSNQNNDLKCNFIDLINPSISFDFLGGIYLSVFRRSMWTKNLFSLEEKKMNNELLFSNFENTFPHVKIFAYAFKKSKAFFISKPLTINLHGTREWSSLYPIIRSIRLPTALDIYFKNGLGFFNYIKYKNYSLQYFLPDVIKLASNFKNTYPYFVEIIIFYVKNFYYPNIYLSIIYQLKRTISKTINEKKMSNM